MNRSKKNTIKRVTKIPLVKNTSQVETVKMPAPSKLAVSMLQHKGDPCEPLVKKGDAVTLGQMIGNSKKFVCAPVHAPCSGTVEKVESRISPTGEDVSYVVIASDDQNTPSEQIRPPSVHSTKEFIEAVRASGLIGCGGQGTPTHVTLSMVKETELDVLIIDAMESEPIGSADERLMIEQPEYVIEGAKMIMDHFSIQNTLIGIDLKNEQAIEALEKANEDSKITVMPQKGVYPLGAENLLVYALTGKIVRSGQKPQDVGALVLNVTTIGKLAEYMKTGMPVVEKRITIAGNAIKKPCNLIVPVGTAFQDIFEYCEGNLDELKKVVLGGPMRGAAYPSLTDVVDKQSHTLLFFDEKQAAMQKESACIRCGLCVQHCPMRLLPLSIDMAVRKGFVDMLEDYYTQDCIECGSCNYHCPAKRHLMQSIFEAKAMLATAEKGGK